MLIFVLNSHLLVLRNSNLSILWRFRRKWQGCSGLSGFKISLFRSISRIEWSEWLGRLVLLLGRIILGMIRPGSWCSGVPCFKDNWSMKLPWGIIRMHLNVVYHLQSNKKPLKRSSVVTNSERNQNQLIASKVIWSLPIQRTLLSLSSRLRLIWPKFTFSWGTS